jgi:hypothetical protein
MPFLAWKGKAVRSARPVTCIIVQTMSVAALTVIDSAVREA